jgi:hypothetical protein
VQWSVHISIFRIDVHVELAFKVIESPRAIPLSRNVHQVASLSAGNSIWIRPDFIDKKSDQFHVPKECRQV